MLTNNLIALIATFAIAVIWLRLNDFTAHKGWISGSISRKIIHIGTGPLFVLCWLLFKNDPISRYLAAVVPLTITAQFFLVGIGLIKDQAAVEAMSRTGEPREILRGPLYYGIVFAVLTILYWYDSPIGIVALMLMCGGDGLADIIGTKFGKTKIPWNASKSWLGTLAMFLGGWVFAITILGVYKAFEIIPGAWNVYLPTVALIALAGTAVETLPLPDVDNLTVTLTAIFMGHILLK